MFLIQTMLMSLMLFSLERSTIKTEIVEYKVNDVTFRATVSYDLAHWAKAADHKLPVVIIMPEWWGLTNYPKRRAIELAELGYVGFAADMYGEAQSTTDPKQAGAWSKAVMSDDKVLLARSAAVIDAASKLKMVDAEKMVMIGYCFGGSVSLKTAYAGQKLSGIVAFHSGLPVPTEAQAREISTPILVLHGTADPTTPPEKIADFEKAIKQVAGYFQIKWYKDARHAFTNPDADKAGMDAVKYDAQADAASWDELQVFLKKAFAGQLR